MRFLAKACIPIDSGNTLCRDKELNRKMETVLSDVRPESVYFGVENGQRAIFCIVNVEGGHELSRIAEPFWLGFKADVTFTPVMNQEDFKKAASHIESAARKYNW